jgi:O-antigen ligase
VLNDPEKTPKACGMTVSLAARPDRALFDLLADGFAIAVAVALPWSTSVTAICVGFWFAALVANFDWPGIRREVLTAAGGLPVLLWALGAAGMLWADVDWPARFAGLGSFARLLAIPLLLAQFRRSDRGTWVFWGFLISSTVVLLASFALVLIPGLAWRGKYDGVPVHDYIYQSSAFLICGFGALGCVFDNDIRRDRSVALGLAVIGIWFLADFGLAAISRAALVVAPVLVLVLGWRAARWRGVLAACAAALVIGTALWFTSASLRARINGSVEELRDYVSTNDASSTGQHIAFLRESWRIVDAAPILGHGTGSIAEQFQKVTAGASGAAGVATVNPHDQTFAVAIQVGIVGVLVLWAMWIAHLLLFRGDSAAAWIGLVIVIENILSSTVHTHLFDFSNGWLYIFGVGVAGGSALRERARLAPSGGQPSLGTAGKV